MSDLIVPARSLVNQIFRFGIVGVIAFLVNAAIVEAAVGHIGPIWAQIIAFPLAATLAWWLNRNFTFSPSVRKIHHELLRYRAANAMGWLANNGVYFVAVFAIPLAYSHPALAVAAGSLSGMALNFISSKRLVFSH